MAMCRPSSDIYVYLYCTYCNFMCSAENYSVVGSCTPNFRRLRRGRSRPRRPLFLIKHGFLPTYWDLESFDIHPHYTYTNSYRCWGVIVSTTITRGSGSPSYTSLTHPPTLLTTTCTCRFCLCPLEWPWTAKSATSILIQLL